MMKWTLEVNDTDKTYILRIYGNEFVLTRSEFLNLYELLKENI